MKRVTDITGHRGRYLRVETTLQGCEGEVDRVRTSKTFSVYSEMRTPNPEKPV